MHEKRMIQKESRKIPRIFNFRDADFDIRYYVKELDAMPWLVYGARQIIIQNNAIKHLH